MPPEALIEASLINKLVSIVQSRQKMLENHPLCPLWTFHSFVCCSILITNTKTKISLSVLVSITVACAALDATPYEALVWQRYIMVSGPDSLRQVSLSMVRRIRKSIQLDSATLNCNNADK